MASLNPLAAPFAAPSPHRSRHGQSPARSAVEQGTTLNADAVAFQPGTRRIGPSNVAMSMPSPQGLPSGGLDSAAAHSLSGPAQAQQGLLASSYHVAASPLALAGGILSAPESPALLLSSQRGSWAQGPAMPPWHAAQGGGPSYFPSMSASPGHGLQHNGHLSPAISERSNSVSSLGQATPLDGIRSLNGPVSSDIITGWGASSIASSRSNMQQRRSRGPTSPIQPIKTTGHNSTPSVSHNPAAFAAALSAQRPKRKIIVKLPNEVDVTRDGDDDDRSAAAAASVFQHTIAEEDEDEHEAGKKEDVVARIRQQWGKRLPSTGAMATISDSANPYSPSPMEYAITREDLHESTSHDDAPEFVDIYLPGRSAWVDVKATFEAERQAREEEISPSQAQGRVSSPCPSFSSGSSVELDSASEVQQETENAVDIEDPPSSGDESTLAIEEEGTEEEVVVVEEEEKNNDVGPLQSFTTPQQKHHSSAMSLSVPSSGQPFGPEAMSALGLPSPAAMERSASDPRAETDDVHEALDTREDCWTSAPATPAERNRPAQSTGDRLSWRELGRGFGYDVQEEQDRDAGNPERMYVQDQDGCDAQSNASDNAAASYSDVEASLSKSRPSWLRERRKVLSMDVSGVQHPAMSSDSDVESSTGSVEEFSNPSDEEAAREERRQRKHILNMRIPAHDETSIAQKPMPCGLLSTQGRPRADTGETLASSCLGVDVTPVARQGASAFATQHQINGKQHKEFSITPRGPLDNTNDADTTREPASREPMTFSRSSGSTFRATAPVFNPSGTAQTWSKAGPEPRFRLPSITNSSFGSSIGHNPSTSSATGLNAAAPSFVPGKFTFRAPFSAPKLPQLGLNGGLPNAEREMQGREKRTRQEGLAHDNQERTEVVDDQHPRPASPTRPLPSTASIAGDLRGDESKARPPPFDRDARALPSAKTAPKTLELPPPPTLGTFRYQPSVPAFARPGIPTFEPPSGLSTVSPALQSGRGESKEQNATSSSTSVSQNGAVAALQPGQVSSLSDSDPLQDQENISRSPRTPQTLSPALLAKFPLQPSWPQQRSSAEGRSLAPSPLMQENRSSSTHGTSKAPLAPKPSGHKEGSGVVLSRKASGSLASSAGNEEDDLSDIIEELGERMDQALEGWGNKILDEVTIMGQVRPVSMVSLEYTERKTLVEAVGREVGDLLADYQDRLEEHLLDLAPAERIVEKLEAIEKAREGRHESSKETVLKGIAETSLANDSQRNVLVAAIQSGLGQQLATAEHCVREKFNALVPTFGGMVDDQVKNAVQSSFEDIVKKLEDFTELLGTKSGVGDGSKQRDPTTIAETVQFEGQCKELERQLGEARHKTKEAMMEAKEARAELSASDGFKDTLHARVTYLESQLEHEKSITDTHIEKLHLAEKKAVEQRHTAERQADEWQSHVSRIESEGQAKNDRIALLEKHAEHLDAELAYSRDEHNREREAAASSAAEMQRRYERIEDQLRNERLRADTLLEQMRSHESSAAEQIRSTVERASRAEGEVAALEKRIVEQDNKISNMQQLTSAQKLKAAQSGQKLGEVEKRLRELESAERELHITLARLNEMEGRIADREVMKTRLRTAQDNETRLREELAAYQSRFLDVERDLMSMRETLVDRDELEASQAEVSTAREEIAALRGQLAERKHRLQAATATTERAHAASSTPNGRVGSGKPDLSRPLLADVPSPDHGSNTWASIHAPNGSEDMDGDANQSSFYIDESFESARNGVPHRQRMRPGLSSMLSSSSNSTSRAIEQSADGWWS